MTETSSQQKEFVFISVDGKQTKNIAISPPDNLKVEFPPKFTDSELGRTHDKKGALKSKKPPNAFILFRKKYVESLHRLGHHDAMKKVSGWARDAWNKLSQVEKDQYEYYANRAASLYQEWEIRNPQPNKPNHNKNIKNKRTKPSNGRLQNSRPIVSTSATQMPAHLVTPKSSKSSPESIIDALPEHYDSRNYPESFPTFPNNIIYCTPELIIDPIDPSIFSDYFFENNYSIPPLTEIQFNNQYYDFENYYLPNPKDNFFD